MLTFRSMEKRNKEICEKIQEIAELLEIRGARSSSERYRQNAYRKAAKSLLEYEEEISQIYKEKGLKGIIAIKGVGKSIAEKIEELLLKGKIKYLEELREDTAIRQVVTHYFKTKGLSLDELKKNARKRDIVYSRYTKPAKQLIELSGSVKKAKEAIDIVSEWANSRDLDYAIETVFKKWLELDKLKPKEIVKKPYYNGNPLVWSEARKKWFVIDETNTWLEFADTEDKIEWRIVK